VVGCAIVGSAFGRAPEGLALEPRPVDTPWGPHALHAVTGLARPAYLAFRHGLPHRLLPHQIDYRAQAWALREVGCRALLVTSSVGVLDPDVPLLRPLLLRDLLYPDNRLPDGSACTVFAPPGPARGQGHLVLEEGLFSPALAGQVRDLAAAEGVALGPEVVFAYAPGPRTKTPAENAYWAALGGQVNSMTVAPEVVLAAELGLPAAGLVVGHKRSGPAAGAPDRAGVAESLAQARAAVERLVVAFLDRAEPVAPGNHLFRFEGDA